MSKNRVLRMISGLKREEVTGDWRKFRNKELHDLCFSPNTIRMIIRNVRWAGHVARMEEKKYTCRVLVGEPEGALGIVGRIILKCLRSFIVEDGLGTVYRTFRDFVILPSSGRHVECLLF